MRIVIDTNVLFDRDATLAICDDPRPKILPAAAFAERARQRSRDHDESPEDLLSWLAALDIEVENYGPAQAARIAARVADDATWERHARDAMIAGHVEEMDEFWTANPRDFVAVGLDVRHIVDIKSRSALAAVTRDDLAL